MTGGFIKLSDCPRNYCLAAALKNGGKDNVTIALARYRFPQ
jgi:hypothetical protein